MKCNFAIPIILFGLGLSFTCCTKRFNEYPPETYLKKDEQIALMNKFIVSFHDTLGYGEAFNDENLTRLRVIFKLEYYVEDHDKEYFMVSENRGSILGSGFKCYAGRLVINQNDTVFQVEFTTDSFTDPRGHSTKIQFDSLILKK